MTSETTQIKAQEGQSAALTPREAALKSLPEEFQKKLLTWAGEHGVKGDDFFWAAVSFTELQYKFLLASSEKMSTELEKLHLLGEQKRIELERVAAASADAIHKPVSELTPQLTEAVDRLSEAATAMAKTAASQAGHRLTKNQAEQMVKAAVGRVDKSTGEILHRAVLYLLTGGGALFIVGIILGATLRGAL